MERRWVTDEGHRFNFDVTVSPVRSNATARYRIPLGKPATDSFNITTSWEEEKLDTSDRKTSTAGAKEPNALNRRIKVEEYREAFKGATQAGMRRFAGEDRVSAEVRHSGESRLHGWRG